MNTRISLVAGLVALVGIVACEEQPKGVRFFDPEKPLLDTTYMASSTPVAQDKNVLLFDVTGVRCNNCPEAAALARKIADTLHPGRVVVVALYPTSLPSLTYPWDGGFDTMANADAEALTGNLGAIPNLPIGCVDQIKISGSYYLDRATWNGHVNNQLLKTSPLNIDLHTEWITSENKGRVEAKVTYTTAVTGAKHLIYIAVLQSDVVSKQSDKNVKPSGVDEDYVHNHALRKLFTSTTGDTLNAELSAGRVFEKHYYVSPRYNWDPSHMEVVVWVMDAATKEVLHVAKEELKK
jgi:hypothetical protein